MSLWLYILRQLFEYLGMPEDLFVPGLRTPSDSGCAPVNNPVLTLADVSWLADDEGEAFAQFRNEVRLCKEKQPCRGNLVLLPKQSSLPTCESQPAIVKPLPSTGEEALKKISLLEDELSLLRAHIAMIITGQENGENIPYGLFPPSTPGLVLPPPALTSSPAPVSSQVVTTVPPPPPPLPPIPPPATQNKSSAPAINANQQKEVKKISGIITKEVAVKQNSSSIPNMMDVLKEMNKVRLRNIERSEGGQELGNEQSSLSTIKKLE
nr:PREDICTED: mitochondrial fission regulator 2 [Latimeria chalumnae]|eukprot:XP_014351107.1 PREDICTED: mitochondrial fission regulator 2 [Latimeria chalumnae]